MIGTWVSLGLAALSVVAALGSWIAQRRQVNVDVRRVGTEEWQAITTSQSHALEVLGARLEAIEVDLRTCLSQQAVLHRLLRRYGVSDDEIRQAREGGRGIEDPTLDET